MKQRTEFTKKDKKFFSTPRTMQEITEYFNGDAWEANNFQNINLIGRNLKIINFGKYKTVHLVNYDYVDINEDTARYAAHG